MGGRTRSDDTSDGEAASLETTFATDGDPDPDPDAVTVHGDAPPADEPAHPDLLRHGQTIGRYVVVDKVGSGSMGVVYRAFDPDLGRGLALKLVEVRSSRHRRPEEIRARLLREAQAIARVSHPNVVQVYDVGITDVGVYVAMEFVEGMTLKQWMREGPRPWREVVDVFVQAGRGLAAAHAADIVHRDFKPDNVMIGRDGRIRVLDFGLARADATSMSSGPRAFEVHELEDLLAQQNTSLDQSLTARGMIVGTPAYMAPEQHLGSVASPASDQFSYCVALWEALNGERPFMGETHAAVAFNMVHGKIRSPSSQRSVPRWLLTLVRKGLSVKIEDRFGSMHALLEALERDPSRKWRWVGASVAVLATMATAGAFTRAAASLETSVCGGAEERLEPVWSLQRRERIRQAFEATLLQFADASWEAAEASLQRYTADWSRARTDTCRATHVHREQSERTMDLKMACLDQRLADLDALLHLFESAERQVVVSAIDATRELEPIDHCLRLVGSAGEDDGSPRASEPARERLTELKARVRTGIYDDVLDQIDALDELTVTTGDPQLAHDLLELRARVELATGRTLEARETWEQAFVQALGADRPRQATEAATKLAFIVGHRLNDVRGGRLWARTAAALLPRTDDASGRLRASLWSAEASAALAAGKYDEAVEIGEKLRSHWVGGDDVVELATAVGNLGTAMRQKGDYDRAIELHAEALALVEAHYGADHPETAFALRRHGVTLSYAKEHEAALAQLERSLALHRQAQGDENIDVAVALDGMGRALRALDRLDEALARHEEALSIWRKELGNEHVDVAISVMNIGYTLAGAGRIEQALARFQEADAITLKAVGNEHPNTIYSGNAIAKMLLMLERPDEARTPLEQLLRSPAIEGVDPTLVGETRFLLAQAIMAARPSASDRLRARELAREARDAYANKAHHWKDQLAEVEAWLVAHPR